MIDHEARIGLAREHAANLAEQYRRARRPEDESRREAIRRRIASAVTIARRRRLAHDPAYRH